MNNKIILFSLLCCVAIASIGCSQDYGKKAQSFIESNNIKTYALLDKSKVHRLYHLDKQGGLAYYDLSKGEIHRVDKDVAVNVCDLTTNTDGSKLVFLTEDREEGMIPECGAYLLDPETEEITEICSGYDVKLYQDAFIECFNPEEKDRNDFWFYTMDGHRCYSIDVYQYFGEESDGYVEANFVKSGDKVYGSFFTDNEPYDRIPMVGTVENTAEGKNITFSIIGSDSLTVTASAKVLPYDWSNMILTINESNYYLYNINTKGGWTVRNYDDDFNNETDDMYITKTASGSKDSNGNRYERTVCFIIDSERIQINILNSLGERDSYMGDMTFKIQCGANRYDVTEIHTHNDWHGYNYVKQEDYWNLVNLLAKGETIKIHTVSPWYSLYNSTYDFKVDCSYFVNAWYYYQKKSQYF